MTLLLPWLSAIRTGICAVTCLCPLLATAAPAGEAPPAHPFVFFSAQDYRTLLKRQNRISAAALRLLERRVSAELADSPRYQAPYSGCDLDVYLERFSKEDGSATRVASDLALYAYLSGQGEGFGNDVLGRQAAAAAKAILLAWARGGLRENGRMRTDVGQFCEQGAQTTVSRLDVGLQIGRGVAAWVQAQDLLEGLGDLTPSERSELDAFVKGLHALITHATRYWADNAYSDCERYSNHVSVHLLALLSSARLEGDRAGVLAAVQGAAGVVPTPFVKQLSEAIYGAGDVAKRCSPGSAADSFESAHPPALGEIVDRYRSGRSQRLGYPIYSLTALMMAADVMQKAGMAPMRLVGPHGQSLRSALQFYGRYYVDGLSLSATRVPGGAADGAYAGADVSGPGAVTVEGRDDLLEPFVLGYCLDRDPASAAVLRKALSFTSATPVYGIYSRSAPCLAELPGT